MVWVVGEYVRIKSGKRANILARVGKKIGNSFNLCMLMRDDARKNHTTMSGYSLIKADMEKLTDEERGMVDEAEAKKMAKKQVLIVLQDKG
jgi:hypothetical protein